MRASGINAAIRRVMGKLEQKKMCAVGITRIRVARITGFHCTMLSVMSNMDLEEESMYNFCTF